MIRTIFRTVVFAFLLAGVPIPASAQFATQPQYASSVGGTANAVTITIPNFPAVAPTGVPFWFLPTTPNTSDTTLAISGTTPLHIYKPSPVGPVPLTGGELQSSQMAEVVPDGSHYILLSSVNSTLGSIILTPQGYLTPCKITSGSPVSGCTAGQLLPTGDVTGTTALYYEPAFGSQVPIYNGSQFTLLSFGELTLTLNAAHLANTIYDVCVFNNAGTVMVGTNVAWTNSSAGAGSRGSGAGTAQIAQLGGIWTNAVSTTVRNGASTYSVAANQCTVVATIFMDGTNGQISYTPTYGQSRKWGGWNFYNRLPVVLKAGDPNASWNYTNTAWRASNGSSLNSVTILSGLPQETFDLRFQQRVQDQFSNATGIVDVAIGYNSISSPSGTQGAAGNNAATGYLAQTTVVAKYNAPPTIGVNVITSLESNNNMPTVTYFGTEPNMLLTAAWRG